MEFAEAEFELNEVQDDGLSARTHLESVWRQTGSMPEQLNVPDCPIEVAYIWGWFLRLNQKRESGMGINPIRPSEIESWMRQRGIRPSLMELDTLDTLDSIFIKHCNKKSDK